MHSLTRKLNDLVGWILFTASIVACVTCLASAAPPPTTPPPQLAGWQVLTDATGADQRHYATYRTAPNLAVAPPANVSAPWEVWTPAAPAAGARFALTLRELPAPTSQPATQPTTQTAATLPPLQVHKPTTQPAGYGLDLYNHVALQDVRDQHFQGYEQGIVAQVCRGGLSLTNVRSTYAYRAKASDTFLGNGLYLDSIPGPVSLTSCLFGYNGWSPGRPASDLSEYRHGIYANAGASPPDLDHCILVGNSNSGAQFRNGGRVRNSVIIDNGTGILAVMGSVSLEHCTIYGGHHYSDNGGKGTGNTAILAYCPVSLKDVWIVGRVGQERSPVFANVSNLGAVLSGGTWANGGEPPWHDTRTAGRTFTANGCLVTGWPGGPVAATGDGWEVRAAPIDYDPTPVLNLVLANKLSVADGADRLQAEIRARVK